MPRSARVVIPDVAHHVTQRGNNRQDVFFRDEDRRVYLDILKKQSTRYGLKILGYCLMSNHVHLVATPAAPDSLAKAFGRTNFTYTQYVNEEHLLTGHLWQNRFFSCPLDTDHFWRALCYVERNPVRAGLVGEAWSYPWSSAAAHVGALDNYRLINIREWKRFSAGLDWKAWLSREEDKRSLQSLRLYTSRGRPLGSDEFISRLEKTTGRQLRPLPVGRPRKK